MPSPRVAFLDAVEAARRVLAHEAVAARWDDQSVLAEFTVRGLSGHLARVVIGTLGYVEASEPRDSDPIAAGDYYTRVVPRPADVTDPVNVDVRARGEETAALGHAVLLEDFDAARARLEAILVVEPPSRLVQVFGDLVIRLDDYLETRIVEALVHTEDLALSVNIEPPQPPEDALDIAIGHLVGVARRKHGGVAVLRALARRERDEVNALRVL
jgi:mycothiol maleylpyruvate isomerase-like protein